LLFYYTQHHHSFFKRNSLKTQPWHWKFRFSTISVLYRGFSTGQHFVHNFSFVNFLASYPNHLYVTLHELQCSTRIFLPESFIGVHPSRRELRRVIFTSAGASLDEPSPERQSMRPQYFPTTFLVLTFQQIHLYGPLHLALSNMALPLLRQIKLFATSLALSGPFQGRITP